MKKGLQQIFSCFIMLLSLGLPLQAQTTFGDSLSVKAQATVQLSPASITINWPADADASGFEVYRKLKSSSGWGTVLATLAGSASQYVDLALTVGVLYDYKIKMLTSTAIVKYGYLSSGIDVKANSDRGIAIVVVENSFISNSVYQTAINQLIADVELDGWFPKIVYVNKTDSVTIVKNQIVAKYNEDAANTKLLLLFGNVPVPYSGDLNPDGHPDHKGAWPTDTYYADIDGDWTDTDVNDLASSNTLNHNIPGDGKFDNSYIPNSSDLQVGRVDLSNLTSTFSEENLLLNYLNKLHRFKTAQMQVSGKALIDDNFGLAEGFSQNGYNNFAAIVGRDSIVVDDYFTQLSYNTSTTGTYLWSFGCGGGNYTSAAGVGSSTNFLSDSLSSVFTMLFGSYFGDWNYQDAFIRAAIAQGNTLTSAWVGRPNWCFQHMAMGENIGYSTMLTQNNYSTYVTNSVYTNGLGQQVSINLMGDPTLRNTYPAQPSALQISSNGNSNVLTWTDSGAEDGYNVYRRYDDSTHFLKLNATLLTNPTFTDTTIVHAGIIHYYVKAVKKTTTPSGTYDNESLGIKATQAMPNVGINAYSKVEGLVVYPNPFTENIVVKASNMVKIEVVNYQGQLLKSIDATSNTIELNLGDLPAGVYIIAVRDVNGFVGHQRVVKLK